jgi:hypothetical protein
VLEEPVARLATLIGTVGARVRRGPDCERMSRELGGCDGVDVASRGDRAERATQIVGSHVPEARVARGLLDSSA